jgi:hypothetical protein
MATYSGSCIVDPDFSRDLNEKFRSGKLRVRALEIPQPAKTKVRELPENLPAGRKIAGANFPVDHPTSVEQPGAMIVETSDVFDLLVQQLLRRAGTV